jgi:hypothetical protein
VPCHHAHRASLLAAAALAARSLALPCPAASFDGARAAALVHALAGDRFAGRHSGLPSGARTEDHVASRFAALSLAPGGADGTFFHPFPLLATSERAASLTLLDGPFAPLSFLYGDDFTMVTNSGSGDVTAEVVLVGHGLSSPDREWNDYAEVDVAGKIVLVLRGTPDNGYDWGQAGSRDSTLHEAMRRGAAAVLFRSDPRAVQGAAVHEGSYFPKTPIAVAGARVLDHLLMDTGWDVKRMEKELKEKPTPLATGKRLRFRAKVSRVDGAHARNVVALLPGSDPRLADEIVLVGGHMDHVGRNGEGIVYNGANDNGSGTSVVMELARSFAESGERPARTLAFATFAAEEQGLLGSEAFAKEPPFDLGRVVAMLNFDMVGHGNGKVGLGGGEYYPEIRDAFAATLDSARADSLVIGRTWRGATSDHAPFRDAGICVMNVWSEGDHRFYHTLQDDAQWVDEAVLGSVGRMAEAWIRTLAEWPEPLAAEHRAGRSLLWASDQIDFDGGLGPDAPPWVRASVRWFDAAEFGTPAYLDVVSGLRRRAAADSAALVRTPAAVRDSTKSGRPGTLVGLRLGGAPPARAELLAGLEVGLLRWHDGAALPDSAALAGLAKSGAIFLLPPESAHAAKLPKGAKRCVRFFPGRGQQIAEPDSIPRKGSLFVLAHDGTLSAAEVAAEIEALARDRVHLDLVPWLATAAEPEMRVFLEEVQAAGSLTPAQMADLLGDNLRRL